MPEPKIKRELQALMKRPCWEWPDDAADVLVATLRDDRATEADQRVAAELAGEVTVINEALVDALLATISSGARADEVRGRAAIALGPVLEGCDLEGFEDDLSDPPVPEPTFRKIQKTLRTLHADETVPKLVRRKVLEAAVRAAEDWHTDAIRAAFASADEEWKLTAVFCMGYIRGFDKSIVQALRSPHEDTQRQAIIAAGNWGVADGWSHVTAVVGSSSPPKPLLLAAIAAVAGIRPKEAAEVLADLASSDDEEITEAVEEALALAEAGSWEGGDDEEQDENEDEDEDENA